MIAVLLRTAYTLRYCTTILYCVATCAPFILLFISNSIIISSLFHAKHIHTLVAKTHTPIVYNTHAVYTIIYFKSYNHVPPLARFKPFYIVLSTPLVSYV